MEGGLNRILPEPISEENQRILLDHIKGKMRGAAGLAVMLLRAMEDHFGPEARDVVRAMARTRTAEPRSEARDPREDLRAFCAQLERACVGSHQWERVVDEPDRIGYRFTRCMWAEVFRELGEPELGLVICASDEPAVKAYNPELGFRRTKILMSGDQICDHIFLVEGQRSDDVDPGRLG
jgi:hypothetical protein